MQQRMESLQDLDFTENFCLLAHRWGDRKANSEKLKKDARSEGGT